ncbi:cupin domain-containing protein [Sulfobacillus sp. DSM 109850]|uniref:Cupin domain-containing protein n=2 Tax=Sulfobacillus harzensis TaxID=2729629 RepID=A0A7Y0Q473_9FIRM|nr:cupin domain-containing protein [Sulfobacillus harzensis]
MQREYIGPLWSNIQELNTIEPRSKAVPYLWRWARVKEYIERATNALDVGPEAERRAVFFINPGMSDLEPVGWGGATPTLYMAVQAVRPGEIAPAHRHTNTALRFIVEGHGATGRIDGEKASFEPGDFLVTPTWTWHDHANEGNEIVYWIDCLDVPFTKYLGVCFTEFYPQAQQELTVPDNYSMKRYGGGMVRPISDRHPKAVTLARYSWQSTWDALVSMTQTDPDPWDAYAVEYINPSTGRDADGRIGARLQLIPPTFHGEAHRHVHSVIYHVFRGSGYSVIDGIRFDWNQGDFFVVPGWSWHEHVNSSSTENAVLFSCNDLPIMETFDFERVENLGGSRRQQVRSVFSGGQP